MHLSIEQLSDIVRSLRTDERAGMEKRKTPRVGLRAQGLVVFPDDITQHVAVWIRDVSPGGFSFVHHLPLAEGSGVSLLLKDREGGLEAIGCTVMHSRKVASDLHSIGARFNDYNPKKKRSRALDVAARIDWC
jgi:hypothetical protein